MILMEIRFHKKVISYISNGKAVITHLIVGLMKKTLYKMSKYFPTPYKPFGRDINIKVDLPNHATTTTKKFKIEQELIRLN